jgi:hypothetical protein
LIWLFRGLAILVGYLCVMSIANPMHSVPIATELESLMPSEFQQVANAMRHGRFSPRYCVPTLPPPGGRPHPAAVLSPGRCRSVTERSKRLPDFKTLINDAGLVSFDCSGADRRQRWNRAIESERKQV